MQITVYTMAALATVLGLKTAQGARTFVKRHGIPFIWRGDTMLVRISVWEDLVELAEESGGDWGVAAKKLQRRRRDNRGRRRG